MELRAYLETLIKQWRVVVPAFIITLIATIWMTHVQPSIYSSTATFVLSPTADFGDVRSFASGLDTLSRRTEIATTFSYVATSRTVRQAALAKLNLTPEQKQDLSTFSQLVAGTNIMKIVVEARHPGVARDVANAVGEETIAYAQTLYEAYLLRPLDPATTPKSPVRPAKARNFILGGLFGLALGAGLAFLADYLQTPVDSYVALNVLDAETGAYNRNYFMQRLDQELARAERQGYPLSIALLNIDHMDTLKEAHSPGAGAEMLRKATVFLKQSLRQEDLVAYFGEATYGLLLPDMSEEVAKALMARIQTRIAWTPFELEHSGVKINLNSAVGIASLARGSTQCEELLEEAKSALHRAGAQRYDSSHLATEDLITQPQQPAEN